MSLIGMVADHGRHARIAFIVAAGIVALVVAFQVIAHIANNNQGKVFGIQIGYLSDCPYDFG